MIPDAVLLVNTKETGRGMNWFLSYWLLVSDQIQCFTRTDNVVYILLCSGTKRGQQRDIAKAIKMTETITAEDHESEEPGTGTL